MEIVVNYLVVFLGAVFLFVMGMLWYGPLFGKQWGKIFGADHLSKEEMAKMQKEMMPYYLLQFGLTLVTSYVMYHFVKGWDTVSGAEVGFWIWLGFVMPMAAGSMWDTKKGMKLRKFLITAGYNLVVYLALGYLFSLA